MKKNEKSWDVFDVHIRPSIIDETPQTYCQTLSSRIINFHLDISSWMGWWQELHQKTGYFDTWQMVLTFDWPFQISIFLILWWSPLDPLLFGVVLHWVYAWAEGWISYEKYWGYLVALTSKSNVHWMYDTYYIWEFLLL